jgi:AraC-like DNA-binding protein
LNSPPIVFAVDYGSYAVTFTVSSSPAAATVAATARCGGQMPDHHPPGGILQPRDPAGQTARRQRTGQARTDDPPSIGEPMVAGCPVCGAPADLPPAPSGTASPLPSRVMQAAERTAKLAAWMAANAHRRDVTVAEIAEVAGISTRRVQAVVKRDFGRRPLQLLADIRLHRVHLALAGPGPAPASIAEAAELAGHSRVARFRAAYRARYGQDPAIPPPAAPPGTTGTSRSSSPEAADRADRKDSSQ